MEYDVKRDVYTCRNQKKLAADCIRHTKTGYISEKTIYKCEDCSESPAFCRKELEELKFVPGQKYLVLYGPVGVGKTHMAIAAGVKACNLGYKIKFLVLKLAETRKNGTLERLLDLHSLDLLILDEWGYVPVDEDGSQLLFRVISDSYESKSLVLTTNLEFPKWGGIFTDDQMAVAMIDRLFVAADQGDITWISKESVSGKSKFPTSPLEWISFVRKKCWPFWMTCAMLL